MIDLTPLEVRKKKGDFRRGIRGYDQPQVDEFLELVADRLEALVRENLAMKDRVGRLEQQVTDYRDREKALTEALVTAQEMREEVRSQVAREADLARRQAEQDVENIRARAGQVREREEDMLKRLRTRQLQFVQTYRAFLEREMSDLESIASALEMNEGLGEVVHGGPVWPTEPGGGGGRPVGPRSAGGSAGPPAAKTTPAGGKPKAAAEPASIGKATTGRGPDRPSGASRGAPVFGAARGGGSGGAAKAGPGLGAAAAAKKAVAVDPEQEEAENWVDDLLSQPALQPVRPLPLKASSADAAPTPPARPAPARTPTASAAELILSDEDLLDDDVIEDLLDDDGIEDRVSTEPDAGDLADEIDALLSNAVGEERRPVAGARGAGPLLGRTEGAAGDDADDLDEAARAAMENAAAAEAAFEEEMRNLPTWTVEPAGGRGAGNRAGDEVSDEESEEDPGDALFESDRERSAPAAAARPAWAPVDVDVGQADALWDGSSPPAGADASPTADAETRQPGDASSEASPLAHRPGHAPAQPNADAQQAGGPPSGTKSEAESDSKPADMLDSAATGEKEPKAAAPDSEAGEGSAVPSKPRDANLGLSLVPEPEKFQDFGDFSDLKGSSDYGLLPDVPDDASPDLSALTLRPNAHERARAAEQGAADDASDDDPEDLLSTVFGDGR